MNSTFLATPFLIFVGIFGLLSNAHSSGGMARLNDRIVTIGSIQIEAPVLRKPMVEVPGLENLATAILRFPVDPPTQKHLLSATLPLGDRTFSRATTLSTELIRRLERNTATVITKITVNKGTHPVIASVTFGKETILLPAFYEAALNNPDDLIENVGVLFHETVSIAYPEKLSSVRKAEEVKVLQSSFQRYLRGDSALQFFEKLGTLCGYDCLSGYQLLWDDVQRGVFQKEVDSQGMIPLSLFIHPSLVQIHPLRQDISTNGSNRRLVDFHAVELRSTADLMIWISELQTRFPTSSFVRHLAVNWERIQFRMAFGSAVADPSNIEMILSGLKIDPNYSSPGPVRYSRVAGGLINDMTIENLIDPKSLWDSRNDYQLEEYGFTYHNRYPFFDVAFGVKINAR